MKLPGFDLSRLAGVFNHRQRRAPAQPTIVVSRRPRQIGSEWTAARSYLGGAPRLGAIPWPRGTDGRPPSFLAQIDLADVAAIAGPTPLPATGSLAFFVGGQPVVYVPRPGADFTEVPADAPSIADAGYGGTGISAWPNDPHAPRTFPRWPVNFTVINVAGKQAGVEVDEEERFAAQAVAVERLFKRRGFNFSAKEAFARLGDAHRPQWWHSAIHYADCLRVATNLGIPSKRRLLRDAALAKFDAAEPKFRQFISETASWVDGRDPWTYLGQSDAEHLAAVFERGKSEFGEFTRFHTPHSYDDLATVTLLALATADDRAYTTLPEPVRALINEAYLLPIRHWHQIFGDPIDIQGNAAGEIEGNVLLLRLTYDDMIHWSFGDNGAYHFYIAPDDLSRRNWPAAKITFECH